jgi:hypothetical protein
MENDKPLKWKLKLTVELAPSESVEYNVTEWKRGGPVDLASLGLSMDEGKTILAGIQTQMVARIGLGDGSGYVHSMWHSCAFYGEPAIFN